ncbi:MAG: histidine phosphatase family protein [Pseudomonadales bacterium]|nr:histidine phosphatase family protein [Pseudomonadales bacterium]
MNMPTLQAIYITTFMSLLILCLSATGQAETLNKDQLITALQQGGLIIYWRHGATDHNQQDAFNLNMADCSTQRGLSEKGKQQATYIGEQFKELQIPVTQVISSPYCRCKHTAELAFSKITLDDNLFFTVGLHKTKRDQQSKILRNYLSDLPDGKGNTVLVSHTANLKEATGIWPKPEAVMHIFRPLGNSYKHLGSISPDSW